MTENPPDPDSPGAFASEEPVASSGGNGETLRELVEAHGPLTWPVVRWLVIQIAGQLEPVHEQGASHGNLSPETLRLAQPWPAHQVEIVPGAGSASGPRDDLHALGRTLVWLLSGAEDPAALPADCDAEARQVLAALSEGRISGAGELLDLLIDGLLDSLPPAEEEEVSPPPAIQDSRNVPPPPKITSPPRQGKSALPKIAAAAAAVVLLGTGSYFLFLKGGDSKDPLAKEETVAREKEAQEKAAREAEERKRIEQEQAAKEKAELERMAREKEEELARQKQAEEEKLAMERAAREKEMEAEREQAAREAAMREAEALVSRGEEILENPDAPASDKEKAFAELLPLARDGNIKAIELCGAAYWLGNGIARDQEEARRWFEEGAKLGNTRSMLGLGYCHEQGIGGPKDMAKAAEWWTRAAEGGEALAMNRLGEYYNLEPDAKDVALAMSWWEKAAGEGIREAMTNLGILHAAGAMGEPDPGKAIALWEKATGLGEPRAMTLLGFDHFNDENKSDEEAFRLFDKAAKLDFPPAMTGLGVCYLTGRGTAADKAEAGVWLRRARDRGDPSAEQYLKQLE